MLLGLGQKLGPQNYGRAIWARESSTEGEVGSPRHEGVVA